MKPRTPPPPGFNKTSLFSDHLIDPSAKIVSFSTIRQTNHLSRVNKTFQHIAQNKLTEIKTHFIALANNNPILETNKVEEHLLALIRLNALDKHGWKLLNAFIDSQHTNNDPAPGLLEKIARDAARNKHKETIIQTFQALLRTPLPKEIIDTASDIDFTANAAIKSFDGIQLGSVNLKSPSFSDATINNTCFDDAYFTEPHFYHTNITHSSFNRATFQWANMTMVTLTDCHFSDVDFSRIHFSYGVKFIDCDLTRVNFTNFHQNFIELLNCNIKHTVFFTDTQFNQLFIKMYQLYHDTAEPISKALLQKCCRFFSCKISFNAKELQQLTEHPLLLDLLRAVIASPLFNQPLPIDFLNALYPNTQLSELLMQHKTIKVSFNQQAMSNLQLQDTQLLKASLCKSQISESHFTHTTFDNVNLSECELSKSNMKNTTFNNCNFTDARVSHCDFAGATFQKNYVSGTQFYLCNFKETNLFDDIVYVTPSIPTAFYECTLPWEQVFNKNGYYHDGIFNSFVFHQDVNTDKCCHRLLERFFEFKTQLNQDMVTNPINLGFALFDYFILKTDPSLRFKQTFDKHLAVFIRTLNALVLDEPNVTSDDMALIQKDHKTIWDYFLALERDKQLPGVLQSAVATLEKTMSATYSSFYT